MRKSLYKFAVVTVGAAFVLTPGAGFAQDAREQEATEPAMPAMPAASMNAQQDAAMQAWPADQQAAFKLWPAETQRYYWSLTDARQKMFWALTDSDKVALAGMAEPQRESTWAQIESQLQPPSG